MHLNLRILIVTIAFIQIIGFITLNCIQNKPIHPHTSNQISASKNLNIENILDKRFYLVSYKDINQTNKNSFYENLFFKYEASFNPIYPNQSLKNSDYGFIFLYKIIDFIIFLDIPDLFKVYISFFIIHLLISFYIINKIHEKNKKYLFIIGYTLNPIIFFVISYPTYYFIQCLGGFILAKTLLNSELKYKILFFDLIILFLIILNRNTGIGFLLGYVFIFCVNKYYLNFKALIILIGSVFLFFFINAHLENKNINRIWHTVGLGLNAYNFQNLDLSDDYLQLKVKESYYEKFNEELIDAGPNNDKYTQIIREEYFMNFNKNHISVIKNAIFNNVSIFGYGYISNNKILIILNLLIGLVCIVFSLRNNYKLLFLIIICEVTYTIYYPPILVYRFGSYILLAFLYINLLSQLFDKYFSKDNKSS